jgi:hypothetical protein
MDLLDFRRASQFQCAASALVDAHAYRGRPALRFQELLEVLAIFCAAHRGPCESTATLYQHETSSLDIANSLFQL